jgi:hypothetical protein
VLEDVDGANFQNIQWRALSNAPSFSLRNVQGFNLHQSQFLPDQKLEREELRQF